MGKTSKSSLFYHNDEPEESKLLSAIRAAASLYPAATPQGYARKPAKTEGNRILTVMLSDLHFGSDLDRSEHLVAFSNKEEARALGKVLQNVLSYKIDKRAKTTLHIDLLGDEFAGLLGHDDRAVAPLTFQLLRSAHLIAQFIEHSAAQFPSVLVTKVPGNHGRNLLRHHGRADNQKWDNFETIMMQIVRERCRSLKNVTWRLTQRPIDITLMWNWRKLRAHGDTTIGAKPGPAASFQNVINSINSSPYYGGLVDIFELGHWHSGQQFSVNHSEVFVNPALIPPDGHSESGNYLTACGQFLFESTEKYAVGDIRKVRVMPEDYQDSSLDGLISAWSKSMLFTDVPAE